MKRRFPQSLVIALIVVGFLIAGLGGWFTLIGPQHSKASDLDRQIADTNSAITAARALTLQSKQNAAIRDVLTADQQKVFDENVKNMPPMGGRPRP